MCRRTHLQGSSGKKTPPTAGRGIDPMGKFMGLTAVMRGEATIVMFA